MSATETVPSPAAIAASKLLDRRRRPMPFSRLLQVQLRAWRGQRGMVWCSGIAIVLGVGIALFGVNSIDGTATAALVRDKFGIAPGFTMLWLAIGVVAGSAPFRSGWAGMVLCVAPRRLRWLAASYASVLGWAAGTLIVFGALSVAATALLTGGAAVGVLGALPSVAVKVLVDVTIGFALGSVFRSVALPLMAGYFLTSLVPLLDGPSKGVSRLFDINAATQAAAGAAAAPHGIGPVIAALVLWTVVPVVVAAIRLQRSDVR
jgi:hypothetical protein